MFEGKNGKGGLIINQHALMGGGITFYDNQNGVAHFL